MGWAGEKSGIFSFCRYDPVFEDATLTLQQRKNMIMKRSFKVHDENCNTWYRLLFMRFCTCLDLRIVFIIHV